MSGEDNNHMEIIRSDYELAKELHISFGFLPERIHNKANLIHTINPSILSPLGILNSLPELYENNSEFLIPEMKEDDILSVCEREDGMHFLFTKDENKSDIKLFCNIDDKVIKLQLNNFIKFIRSHSILSRLFSGNLHDKISIRRVNYQTMQLAIEQQYKSIVLRNILENLIEENVQYIKELGTEAFVVRNKSAFFDDEDFDYDIIKENNEEKNDKEDENEEEEENEEEPQKKKFKPNEIAKIKVTITIKDIGFEVEEIEANPEIININDEDDDEEQSNLKTNDVNKIWEGVNYLIDKASNDDDDDEDDDN